MRGICLEEASVLRHATSGNTLRVGEGANSRHFDCVCMCVVVRLLGVLIIGYRGGFNFFNHCVIENIQALRTTYKN